jgi:membrane protein YqaA with SNARE-associated domain
MAFGFNILPALGFLNLACATKYNQCAKKVNDMEAWVEWGYLGLFLASFLAATILPFSSEVVMALMLAGPFTKTGILLSATAGNWLGGITSYFLGYLARWNWIEKYLRTKQEDVYKFRLRIERYGSLIAFFCWLPFIGDLLAVALGVFRIQPARVFTWMLVGKFLRYLLIVLGVEALFL